MNSKSSEDLSTYRITTNEIGLFFKRSEFGAEFEGATQFAGCPFRVLSFTKLSNFDLIFFHDKCAVFPSRI